MSNNNNKRRYVCEFKYFIEIRRHETALKIAIRDIVFTDFTFNLIKLLISSFKHDTMRLFNFIVDYRK